MRIALPVVEKSPRARLSAKMGQADWFLIYNTRSGDMDYLQVGPSSEPALAAYLADHGVRAVIAGRCGARLSQWLDRVEVVAYQATAEDVPANLRAFQRNELAAFPLQRPVGHSQRLG